MSPCRSMIAPAVLLCLVTLIASCGQQAPPQPIDSSFEELDMQGVIAAHERWVGAYEAQDVPALLDLLDARPNLLIFHPLRDGRFDAGDDLAAAMERMFAELGTVRWTDFHGEVTVQGSVGWHTSQVLLETDAAEEPLLLRGTEIWVRAEEGWRLAHGHWSKPPEAN